MVTSHAVEVPMTMVPAPTPSISQSVLATVRREHGGDEVLPDVVRGVPNAVRRTEPSGTATSRPIAAAATVQASGAKRRRPRPVSGAPAAATVMSDAGSEEPERTNRS